MNPACGGAGCLSAARARKVNRMRISLNWLTDYVDVSIGAAELAARLTDAGLSCEEIVESDNDIVLNLEVTSNRGDCLGHLGVAREVAAVTGAKFHPQAIADLPRQGRCDELTSVRVEDAALCPRYTARVIQGVKVGPSPAWMVERLQAVGMRSINNVVDVTNYVLMEYSQPLHSFDYDRLGGHAIVVRRAREGELLVSIDQTKCRLDPSMLVIADADKPVAIAGVMGGLDSEVSDRTVNVLLESAQFDPLCIRRTSRKLALMSESNYRFERGVDPCGVEQASLRACQLIIQLAGGRLAEGIVDVWARPVGPVEVALRPQRTCSLLGLEIETAAQVEILSRLGLAPRLEGERIVCTVPTCRADLTREVDLIEEIARLHGYDKIPVGGQVTHAVVPPGRVQRVRQRVGRALCAAGFDEALTFSFVDQAESELFGQARGVRVDPLVRKTNNVLRPTLLPSLLRSCKTNQDAGADEVSLWEIASVLRPGEGAGLSEEHVEVALATTRSLGELRGAVEALVADLSPAARLDVREADAPGMTAGAAAELLLDGKPVGRIGMIDEKVQHYYGLEKPVAAAALGFQTLLEAYQEVRKYAPVPRYPSVRRDLSLIVDDATTWRRLSEIVLAVDQPMRQSLDYVTTYRGKPIPAGKKSVTLQLTYRSSEGTLRSEQVDEQVAQVVAAAGEKLGAELRT